MIGRCAVAPLCRPFGPSLLHVSVLPHGCRYRKEHIVTYDNLSNAAKCVCGGWFAKMQPNTGELTFSLGESKPRDWVVAALKELIGAGLISVRAFNEYGGLVFTPLVDCHWAFEWMMKGGAKAPEAKLPLTEPLKSPREGRAFQRAFLASVDTHAERGDADAAPSARMGSAVAATGGETPNPIRGEQS